MDFETLRIQMKNFFLLLTFLLTGLTVQAQTVSFFEGDYEQAMELAEKESKLLFIDCYTKWCKPCKVMDVEVFENAKVAKYMKKNFICLKIDMETDAGLEIMQKYVITLYPTLIFAKVNGDEIKRESKGLKADEFITLAKGVVKPTKN
jgi:thiol:disulfide interchange protein